MYGQRSNLVTAEYWRWWVVHLWVEGFFEVFATVVIAFLLTRLKLLSVSTATRAGHVLDRLCSCRAASLEPFITSISPEHPTSCSGWARCSARWKSFRWC